MSEKSGSYMAETVMGGGSKRRGACGWWGKGKGLGKGSWERVLGKGLGKRVWEMSLSGLCDDVYLLVIPRVYTRET